MDWSACHVGADGSVFNKYPHFKARGSQALREILDWPKENKRGPVDVRAAEDGSGVGAALIAALTLKRVKDGIKAGVRDPDALLGGTKVEGRPTEPPSDKM